MKKILVIGGNGQLGNCLNKIASDYSLEYEFCFTDYDTLDITDKNQVDSYFSDYQPDFCINASAYTIHVSTDYVFDGETDLPYTEDDFTNPLGVYGASKLEGENLALEKNPKTIIIRTSWLYSEFNKNFVKTMLNLFNTKDELNVVADQFGQPTNANDLAKVIMKIIRTEEKEYGIFHFSNYPETTWFDFAQKIAELSKSKIKINPITTDQYPTPAKRPMRSTMCLDKIENSYNIEPRYWENSLEECMETLLEE